MLSIYYMRFSSTSSVVVQSGIIQDRKCCGTPVPCFSLLAAKPKTPKRWSNLIIHTMLSRRTCNYSPIVVMFLWSGAQHRALEIVILSIDANSRSIGNVEMLTSIVFCIVLSAESDMSVLPLILLVSGTSLLESCVTFFIEVPTREARFSRVQVNQNLLSRLNLMVWAK